MGKTNAALAPSWPGAKLLDGRVFKANAKREELEAWVDKLNI